MRESTFLLSCSAHHPGLLLVKLKALPYCCTKYLYEMGCVIMEIVNISELRANLLSYLKKANQGEEIVITSHGQTLATIVPPADKNKQAKVKLKELAKSAVVGDIVTPADDTWNALS